MNKFKAFALAFFIIFLTFAVLHYCLSYKEDATYFLVLAILNYLIYRDYE